MPEETKTALQPKKQKPESMPVAHLILAEGIDDIGRDGSRSIFSKSENGRSWEVSYVPQMRHFCIEFKRSEKTRTIFVHETRVSHWEPA